MGPIELEHVPFDVRDCVEEAFAMLPMEQKASDVQIGYEMPHVCPSALWKARLGK